MSAPRRPRALATLVLIAAALAWFSPALFFGQTLLSFDERALAPPFIRDADPAAASRPQNLITSDLQGWYLAHTEIAVARLKQGELPLWDSTELLGRPLHADASFPTFYLPDAIYLALPVVPAYAWSMAFHVVWAGIGMLLLLDRIGLRWAAALFGALAFAFSGWMLVHLHIPHFIRSASWLPWLLFASLRLVEAPIGRRALPLALAVGMAALSAYPPVLGVMLFGLGGALLGLLAYARAKARVIAWHAVAIVLGLALSGAAMLPLAELRARSLRAANVSETTAQLKSLRPVHLVALAAPDFQGNPVALRAAGFPVVETHPIARELFSADVQDNYVENTFYGSIAALLLALVALAAAPRRAATWGFLGLFALGLLVAFHSPLQKLFRDHLVPGLGSGSPKRALLLCAFGLAGLAAVGCDELLAAKRTTRWLLGCAAVALAATLIIGWRVSAAAVAGWGSAGSEAADAKVQGLLAAAFTLPALLALAVAALAPWFLERDVARRAAFAGLLLLLVADLFLFGWRFNPFQPPEVRGRRTEVVDFLTKPENGGRTARYLERNLLPASIVSAWGIESVDGIQALLVREVAELLEEWQPGCIDPANPNQVGRLAHADRFALPIVDLLARWIVWNQPPPAAAGFTQRYASEREGIALSENPRALPEAFFVDRVRVINDRDERLAALVAPGFAPSRVAIAESLVDVTELPRRTLVADSTMPADPPAAATVISLRVDPETYRVSVTTPAAGILVLNEAWFPGWRAEGDGRTRNAIRVDHAFLGFVLEPGTHDLVIRYAPASFALGAMISLCAAAALLLLWLFSFSPRAARATSATSAKSDQGEASATAAGTGPSG